jgi:hypothetical protein
MKIKVMKTWDLKTKKHKGHRKESSNYERRRQINKVQNWRKKITFVGKVVSLFLNQNYNPAVNCYAWDDDDDDDDNWLEEKRDSWNFSDIEHLHDSI